MVRHTTDEDEGDGNDTATDDGTVDAHTLSEGDRVEVEATPMRADESGRVTGDVVDATVHTMNDDEVGKSVTFKSDTGNRYVRKGTGTLSVVDDDGFHVTIAWESTLRREPATDGGDDIIVAGDEGVIIDGKCGERGPNGKRCERDDGHAGPHAAGFPTDAARRPDPEPRHVWGDDDAHPDDEGVEILPDGGGSEPTPDDLADLSDGDVVEVDTEDGDTVTLTAEDPQHPNLGGRLGNGQYTRYFARDDGKRVSIRACHDDKNDERRHDASYLINRTKTGGIFDNIDTDKREVVDMRRVETDGGADVTVAIYHDGTEHVVGMERFEAGFVALLIASSDKTIDSPNVDDDRVNAVYDAFMSPVTAPKDDALRADGGNPPGEDVSIAPNYEAGGVWFTLGDMPRRLLSPEDARSVADHVEDRFDPTPDGYDDVDDMADRLRELADDVEAKVDDPHVAAFDDIPLTTPKDGDRRTGSRTFRGP